MVARVIRSIAIACSLLLAISFAMFALDQARSASQDSQNQIAGNPQADQSGRYVSASSHHTPLRRALDDVAGALESPFSSLGVHSSHQWGEHGALLALGLLLYGVGLGFLARWFEGRRSPRGSPGSSPGPPGPQFAG